jgi:hypothetical protein
MEILDKLFQIVFARHRRKLGDSQLQSAWFQASSKVTAYLGWPIVTAEAILTVLIYSRVIKGTAFDSKRALVIVIATVGIALAYCLSRRFRKYSADPPFLPPAESPAETRFVFLFRAISVGAFVVTCVVGYILHEIGAPVLQGLR